MTRFARPFAVCVVALSVCVPPVAAETVKLTVVAAAPPQVTYVKMTKERFIPEVNKRLAATAPSIKVEWTEAYAQTLAKFNEVLESVEDGVAQVGLILKNFEESRLPLEQYMYMVPFLAHNGRQMADIDRTLHEKIPEMKAQYERANQVFIISGGTTGTQFLTTFPVNSVDDLKGRKIGASGAMGHWLRGTGAVIVTASMLSSTIDIKNGVYDGYPISSPLAFAYKTFEAAKYLTETNFGSSATSSITVHKPTWEKLPKAFKDVFVEVAKEWAYWQVEYEAVADVGQREQMVKRGLKISQMPMEERRRWAMQMPNIAKEWADGLEKDGHPGRRVLQAYMDEVRALDIPVARHWDRE